MQFLDEKFITSFQREYILLSLKIFIKCKKIQCHCDKDDNKFDFMKVALI